MNAYIINKTECIIAPTLAAALKEYIDINTIDDVESICKATEKDLARKIDHIDDNGVNVRSCRLAYLLSRAADGDVRYVFGEE